jgi:hypothetical protein
VRVDAHGWVDYMHLGKIDGEWKIINVLWEMRRPASPAETSSASDGSMT